MEITIRFNSDVSIHRVVTTILTADEVETVRVLRGGFYFNTKRHPYAILAEFEADGFELSDFETFEFSTK